MFWIVDAFIAALIALVKPATADSRRVEKLLKMKMPMEAVEAWMDPFSDGDIDGLKWEVLPHSKRLVPTKTTRLNHFYIFELTKGKHLDTLFRLEEAERQKSVKATQWRRGLGCARLNLSQAAQMRGHTCSLLSMVCGKVSIKVTQPRDWRAMPTVSVRMKTLSMDEAGNIILPCEFEDVGFRAALRKQARVLLQKMIDDPLYPTGPMAPALTMGSTTIHTYRPPPPALPAPAPLALE